ncbi:unnamed protein product, partial [Rotaria sp. Silwood1]
LVSKSEKYSKLVAPDIENITYHKNQGQVRKLEDDYQRFIHIYQEIIVRLEKLETLLSDAELILDL